MSFVPSHLSLCQLTSRVLLTRKYGKRGEIVFSKKLGFLETRSDVDGIMADIKTKVHLGGSVSYLDVCVRLSVQN